MQGLEESASSVINPSLLDTTLESQQPIGMATSMSELPDSASDTGTQLSHHTDATTSCEEILMTVRTNKGLFLTSQCSTAVLTLL